MMNRTDFMSREEINKAILKVITTQFKKDAKEEHKIVEDLGYEIFKMDGDYRIRNKRTNRGVYYSYGWLKTYTTTYRVGSIENIRFDFYGYLETTRKVYVEHDYWDDRSESVKRWESLRSAKARIKYTQVDIDRARREIDRLLDDIERATSLKAQYEQELKELRQKYGLAG